MCSLDFLRRGKDGYYFIPKYEQTANAKKCFSFPDKAILIDKIDKLVANFDQPTSLDEAKHHKAIRKTVSLMKVHPPDTAWLIRWIGSLNPDDEIFQKSYKFKRPKQEIDISEEEEYLCNDDGFFDDLPALDDKTIRTTNRLRIPKKVQLARKIKIARATAQKARLREEQLIAARETLDSESSSELEFNQPEAAAHGQQESAPLLNQLGYQLQNEDGQQMIQTGAQLALRQKSARKRNVQSDSDGDFEESPEKKGRKQRAKKTPRGKLSLEALEESKDNSYTSIIKTRSMRKQDLNDITIRMGDVNMNE